MRAIIVTGARSAEERLVRYEPARIYQEDSDLRQVIKWIAIGVGAIVVVSAVAVAYIAATFDPNDYKERIVAAVKEKTGRTLTLDGDIALSLYPSVGAKLGKAALSEPGNGGPFASVESAHVSVKMMPLLSKEVIVDAIDVQGLRLRIEREKSGRMNFDDLTGAGKPAKPEDTSDAPVKVDIAHVEIANADVTYVDRAAGTEYRLSRLDLKTGRVATGVATPVELAATIASMKDKAQIDVRLDTKLTFDLERRIYKLGALDLSAKGAYAGMTALDATVKGNVEARTGSGEYITDALVVALRGKRPDGEIDLKLDAPQLTLTRDKVDGGKLTLNATKRDGKDTLAAKINVGGVKGAFAAVKAGPLDADIEIKGEGRAYKAQLSGALTADLDRKTAGLTFSGKVDNSNVSGKAAVTRFSPLAVSFNLDADDLDADRLMGKAPPGKDSSAKQAKSGEAGAKDDKIDLSALKGIDASGNVRIGKLTLLNLKSADVRAALKIVGGRLDVAPISAQLYQGSLGGSLSAQAADNAVFTVNQTLSGVAVGPLLRDAAQIDTLEGRGTVNANLTTRGATLAALKKALNGTASVKLADGSVRGIDIAGTMRSARNKLQQLRGKPVESASKTEKTDFTELTASFKVVNGVARNDDLSLKSPLLRVAGSGDIDIGNDSLNYQLRATLVATSKGQGGRDAADLAGITVPVQLTGALDQPKWSIDFGGMITGLATSRLKDEILKHAGEGAKAKPGAGVEETIKDRLKGILGR